MEFYRNRYEGTPSWDLPNRQALSRKVKAVVSSQRESASVQSAEQGTIQVKWGENERWRGEEGAGKVGRGQTVKDPVCHAKGLGQQAMGNRGLEDFIKLTNKIKSTF